MDIGNYLNHSEHPNLRYEKGKGYFTLRDIKAGEELFGNYRELKVEMVRNYLLKSQINRLKAQNIFLGIFCDLIIPEKDK